MRARSSHVVLAAGFAFFALTLSSAYATAGAPTDQIKATVDKALVVLRDPRLKPAAKIKEKRELLKQILFARFDFTEMAKRALGVNWRRRTPKEQEEFVRLFTEVLERAYADVNSKVLTNKGEEFSINYKARLVNGEWRVYDVIVENVSMVNNFRSQFSRVIANSSYEELVRRLREKADRET